MKMKNTGIIRLPFSQNLPSVEEADRFLKTVGSAIEVNVINWKDYPYSPETRVVAAYDDNALYLRYSVREEYFKAEMTESNQNVYEDSCVEFFVSPAGDGIYYNFEFNALGTCLMGSGTGRADTKRVDPRIISTIGRLGSVKTGPVKEMKGSFEWTLTVSIPFSAFFRHHIRDLKGHSFRANFYKCGDGLSVPHYVSWNPIGTENPDFHRPEYFGELNFI